MLVGQSVVSVLHHLCNASAKLAFWSIPIVIVRNLSVYLSAINDGISHDVNADFCPRSMKSDFSKSHAYRK
jgi:hypothetical protein